MRLEERVLVKIPAKEAYNYPILIEEGLLENLPKYLKHQKIVIITDDTVFDLYVKQLLSVLNKFGYSDILVLKIKPGEESKNFTNFEYLLNQMLINKCDRHTLCLAVGGGVVGDITGFVCACFMRGIKYIQIPTTLLSMIDSSVGGKTAINTPSGKNLIGAFYQPCAVIMDTKLLTSLPGEQFINGLIEAIKIFLTSDKDYFEYVYTNLDKILAYNVEIVTKIIKRSVELKAQVVEKDEKEQNLRMILNFGHSVGHALEKISNYKILHGYAVALGMLVEARIALLLGCLEEDHYLLIKQIIENLGISQDLLAKSNIDDIVNAMYGDKKNKAGVINIVLLAGVGQVKLTKDFLVVSAIDEKDIRQALEYFK